jgi:hypothetical protein
VLRFERLVGFLPLIFTIVVALDRDPVVDVVCLRQTEFCVTVDDREHSERDRFSVVRGEAQTANGVATEVCLYDSRCCDPLV